MRKPLLLFSTVLLLHSTALHPQLLPDQIRQHHNEKAQLEQGKKGIPDYGNLYFWAAHPDKNDLSDSVPPCIVNEFRDTLADVFFLHPTTYTKDILNSQWNASLDDTAVNDATDQKTILFQASVFNNCCRIFAPRYRQAHLKAYMAPKSEASQAAFDLAYEDLKNAFQFYLDHYNNGRPIIIASHSQGAMHALRLLKEFFDGKPLQKQLVCAYIVGWQIKPDDFKYIPVGETRGATGCFVGWRSFQKGETDFMINNETGGSVCVNPITWTTSTEESSIKQHKGMVGKDLTKVYRNAITASIEPEHGILWVQLPDAMLRQFGKMKNYHIADYNLFYLDIRENAMVRVKAFLGKN